MLDRIRTAIGGGGTRQGRLTMLALAALTAGLIVIAIAVLAQQQAPQASASAWGTVATSSTPSKMASAPSDPPTSATPSPTRPSHSHTPTASSTARPVQRLALPASVPTAISIPAIKVHSDVFAIGKDHNGGLAVPQPGPNLNKVAWYQHSPTPGQIGPSVLEGHIDSVQGRSVFFRLAALKPGNTISVTRADHTVAVFTVDAVRAYKTHDDFPTDLVYGGDLSQPTLRIITCSNFNHATGHYVGNTIVFAHLTSVE